MIIVFRQSGAALRRLMLHAAPVLMFLSGVATFDSGPGSGDNSKSEVTPEREALLLQMRERAEDFQVVTVVDGEKQPAPLKQDPVFRYADLPRGFDDASLWCWGGSGRPVALAKVEAARSVGSDVRYWQFCVASLTDHPMEVTYAGTGRLATRKPGFELRPIDKGPVPDEKRAGRLRQMKELFARFSATVLVDGNESLRQEMRRLSTPIYRYDDERAGLKDGVIFGLTTNGTNPDILIVIELRRAQSDFVWKYGIVKMTYSDVRLRLDDSEVWSSPISAPKDTWTYFQSPRSAP
jgi:hypothetical protein